MCLALTQRQKFLCLLIEAFERDEYQWTYVQETDREHQDTDQGLPKWIALSVSLSSMDDREVNYYAVLVPEKLAIVKGRQLTFAIATNSLSMLFGYSDELIPREYALLQTIANQVANGTTSRPLDEAIAFLEPD